MTVLRIDSSITGEGSVSRSLTGAIVAALTAADASIAVVERDLVVTPLPHLDLSAFPGGEGAAAKASTDVLEQFLAADTVVIGAPMYNFTLPSQLKAWVDRIMVAGRTFRYGEHGPEGMVHGKRVIIAVSSGGLYGPDTPAAAFEHLQTYLTAMFGFIGVSPEFIVADGLKVSDERREAVLEKANVAITALAA